MATVEVLTGDITQLPVDAIVNAANEQLLAGGGVCGAIFAAAGHDELTASCATLGRCPTGSAVITPSHRLADRGIRAIIHAVGPRWPGGTPTDAADDDPAASEADRLLASTYRAALELAEDHGLGSIAFPAISTGIFGFPARRAARVAASTVADHQGNLDRIVLVGFDETSTEILHAALDPSG